MVAGEVASSREWRLVGEAKIWVGLSETWGGVIQHPYHMGITDLYDLIPAI